MPGSLHAQPDPARQKLDCSWVLYDLKHPLFALELVASVCRTRLILWTQIDRVDVDRSAVAFYPTTELNDDPTKLVGTDPGGAAVEPWMRGSRQLGRESRDGLFVVPRR